MALAPGQKLGHYEIRSKIGEGGMGEVYLAEDTTLGRRVAVKFLTGDSIADEEAKKRFLREAQIAARLDHPNICTVHEVAEANGLSFIVMQYLEGETLDVRVKQKPPSVSEALGLATAVADALAEAHDRGIIHRDIKPSNIMITPRGQVKVMDFGLARLSQPTELNGGRSIDREASTQAMLTTPGTLIGTAPFMSPEQVHGKPLDARTDIFSFGVMLYVMLTGVQPFMAESPAGIISAVLTHEPSPVSEYVKGCPAEVERIVRKCLVKDREHRYQTMREVCVDLENALRQVEVQTSLRKTEIKTERLTKPSATEPVPVVRYFNQRRYILIVASIVLVVAAISVYLMYFRAQTQKPTSGQSAPAAYDLYLRAKVLLDSENRENTESAIKLLESAVAQDQNLALAWTELARAYYIKAFYYTPDQAKQLDVDARFAVGKALTIDPNLAEAHFVRGLLLWTYANRFPHEQAIQSYKTALALNPNLDEAHHQLGLVYYHLGLLEKGWAEIEKAVASNPTNTLARFRFGVISVYRGQYEDALSFFNSTPLEKNPSLWAFQTATALFQLGRNEEALRLIDKYLHDYPKDEGGVGSSVRAMIFARAGKTQEAEAAIAHSIEIGRSFGHFHHTAFNIASAYALMNKPEEAVQWLETAAEDGFPCYPLFDKDRNLDSLRHNQRFIKFMARLKQQWQRYDATL